MKVREEEMEERGSVEDADRHGRHRDLGRLERRRGVAVLIAVEAESKSGYVRINSKLLKLGF